MQQGIVTQQVKVHYQETHFTCRNEKDEALKPNETQKGLFGP